jgi:hypothetical protein
VSWSVVIILFLLNSCCFDTDDLLGVLAAAATVHEKANCGLGLDRPWGGGLE